MNWGIVVIISGTVPYIVRAVTVEGKYNNRIGYIFIACGIFSFLGLIFIYIFMKETKGKKKQDIEWMYSSNKEFQGKNAVQKLYLENTQGDVNISSSGTDVSMF